MKFGKRDLLSIRSIPVACRSCVIAVSRLKLPMHVFALTAFLAISCVHLRAMSAQEIKASRPSEMSVKYGANDSVVSMIISLSPSDAKVGEQVLLKIDVEVLSPWHLGAIKSQTPSEEDVLGFPTSIEFKSFGLEAVQNTFFSTREPDNATGSFGTTYSMSGKFCWTRKYRVTGDSPTYGGRGSIRFQACNDEKCLPPQSLTFSLGEKDQSPPIATLESKTVDYETSDQVLEKIHGETFVLKLERCKKIRVRPQIDVMQALFGRAKDELVWKGTIAAGNNKGVSIYLPKAEKYHFHNEGVDGSLVSNTATFVSIDQNGNDVLEEWEACAVDIPVRIRNSMYRIQGVDLASETMTIEYLDIPLKGSIVGFRCPDFEFDTLDGSVVSNKSILGKATVLDIWAVSCHNCYEDFAVWKKEIEKYGSDKLQVVLLTVDDNRQIYESLSPRLFQKYGGADWPQVMLKNGFDGARTIGSYGFGSVVVDETGIVRAVGVHGSQIQSVVAEIFTKSQRKDD